MSSIIEQSLNKCVPVDAPAIIRYNDLIELADDRRELDKIIERQFQRVVRYFVKAGMPNLPFGFFKTFEVSINPDTLEKHLIFSPQAYLHSIMWNLNCNGVNKNESSDLTLFSIDRREIENRLRVLRRICSENKLKKEFPFLYKSYLNGASIYKNYFAVLDVLDNPNVSGNIKDEIKHRINNAWRNSSAVDLDIDQEIDTARGFKNNKYGVMAAGFIEGLLDEEILNDNIKYLYTHPVDLSKAPNFNKDKLELYLVYRFLDMAVKVPQDEKQRYLYFVSNYFMENKDKLDSDLRIHVGSTNEDMKNLDKEDIKSGHYITPRDLYKQYRKLLVNNPNLRVMNFNDVDFSNMNLEQVEEFMELYLKDLGADWEIIPSDGIDEEIIERTRGFCNEKDEEERRLHRERLLDLFIEKKEFYDSCDPFYRIKGHNTFDGYIGYIFTNGKVVLDKFYDDVTSGKVADGHAIYVMNIDEFYELSQLSKSELIRNKMCRRYVHRGDWQSRVKQEIAEASSINAAAEVNMLIKTNRVKGTNEGTSS